MLPYTPTFVTLIFICSAFGYYQHRQRAAARDVDEDSNLRIKSVDAEAAASQFNRVFLPVYLLVMGSDWLQGPYIYTLYKDEKQLDEKVVAALFLTGFGSAALSATFVGALADRYGRRFACLTFCIIYSLSCLSTLCDDFVALFSGRMLGGLATTMMYTVVESWMVTEYNNRRLDKSSLSLSSMFGLMTTLNSAVAIAAAIAGQLLVTYTKTKTAPFLVAVVTLSTAAWLMLTKWNENYGDSASPTLATSRATSRGTFSILRKDKRIIALGFISTTFEGSMYIFVFFWSSALKAAHSISIGDNEDLPFGVIFASFMCSMMLGSLGYSIASKLFKRSSFSTTKMLTITIAVAGTFLMVPIFVKSEILTLLSFCVYELCVGVYFPTMGAHKGRIIDDGVRAQIYGILRIPLNIFVVTALALTKEGDTHRDLVMLFCGGLLLIASMSAAYFLDDNRFAEENHVER